MATSYRLAFLSDIVFGAVSLIIYYYISRTFQDVGTASLKGAPSYFAFAAVGVSIAIVIQGTSVGVATRVRTEQLTGTLEALLVQPVKVVELAFGLAGYQLLFSLFRSGLYLSIAGLLGADYSDADWAGVAVTLLATAVALISLGIAVGALVFVVKRAEAFTGLVVFSLVLVGGAYFPLSVFPGWLEAIASVTPTRFAFEGVRSALFQGGEWAGSALTLALLSTASLPLAVIFFGRGLRFAQRRGTLNQY